MLLHLVNSFMFLAYECLFLVKLVFVLKITKMFNIYYFFYKFSSMSDTYFRMCIKYSFITYYNLYGCIKFTTPNIKYLKGKESIGSWGSNILQSFYKYNLPMHVFLIRKLPRKKDWEENPGVGIIDRQFTRLFWHFIMMLNLYQKIIFYHWCHRTPNLSRKIIYILHVQ